MSPWPQPKPGLAAAAVPAITGASDAGSVRGLAPATQSRTRATPRTLAAPPRGPPDTDRPAQTRFRQTSLNPSSRAVGPAHTAQGRMLAA